MDLLQYLFSRLKSLDIVMTSRALIHSNTIGYCNSADVTSFQKFCAVKTGQVSAVEDAIFPVIQAYAAFHRIWLNGFYGKML